MQWFKSRQGNWHERFVLWRNRVHSILMLRYLIAYFSIFFLHHTRQTRKGENANEVTRLKYYWSTQPKNRCFLCCTVKFIHMHERKDSFTMQFQWDKARKRTKQLLNWRKHVASVCIRLRLLFVLSVLSVVESFCTYVYPDWLTHLLGDMWYRYTCIIYIIYVHAITRLATWPISGWYVIQIYMHNAQKPWCHIWNENSF